MSLLFRLDFTTRPPAHRLSKFRQGPAQAVPWGYTSMSPRTLIAAAIRPLHRAAGPIGIFERVLPAEPAVAPGAGHALLEGIKAAVRSAALDGFCAPRRSRGCIGAQHEGGQQDGCHGEGAHEVPPQSSPTQPKDMASQNGFNGAAASQSAVRRASSGLAQAPSPRVSPCALCGRNVANANHHAANVLCPATVLPVIREIQRSGASPHQIADALNARGISTARGGRWYDARSQEPAERDHEMCIGPRMTTGFCWSSRPTSCRPWPRESDARICCPMRGSATRRSEWQIRPRGRKFWTWRSAHSRWHIGRCLRVNPHPLRRRARHSLPSGRYSLLRPDLHRLDRTSLRLAHLFDHLVGAQKEGLRNVEAERFGGRQVDDQLELGRLLDRNVGGLRPLEDLVNKVARAPEHIRVVYGVHRNREHDWDRRGCLLCGRDRSSHRNNYIHLEPDELGRDFGVALGTSLRPAILDRDGAALDPAEFAHPLQKGGSPLGPVRTRTRAQEPDGRQFYLLRARRDRPYGCRAADQGDELAAFHCQRLPCFRQE